MGANGITGATGFGIGMEGAAGAAGGGVSDGTEEIAPRAGVAGAGTAWRGAAGVTGFAFPTEKTSPFPFSSNGLLISDGTSTCFCVGRRRSKEGLSCVRTSFNGRITATRSLSSPVVKTCGAARRMSPKGTFTEPCASWERTFSNAMETVKSPTSACLTLASRSEGRLFTMPLSVMERVVAPMRGECVSLLPLPLPLPFPLLRRTGLAVAVDDGDVWFGAEGLSWIGGSSMGVLAGSDL